jgi:hypothetical protein
MFRLLSLLLLGSCEYPKTPHVNPREKARIESENRKKDQDQTIKSDFVEAEAKLSLVESTLHLNSVLVDAVLNGEAKAGTGASYLSDHCLLQQRVGQVRQVLARMGQYSCFVRSTLDLASSAQAKVRHMSKDYQIRVVKGPDGSVNLDICEGGIAKAEISYQEMDDEQLSGRFAMQGFELTDGRIAAMTGSYAASASESKFSVKLVASSDGTATAGLRFAMYRQKNLKEFFSYGGSDQKLVPQTLSAASKFDHAMAMGQTLIGLPDLQSARLGHFNAQGQWLADTGTNDAAFKFGGLLHIKSDDLSQPLELSYNAGLNRSWDCRIDREISLTELVENRCQPIVTSQNDCTSGQFRASEPTSSPDFQKLTSRFDQLEFDIF